MQIWDKWPGFGFVHMDATHLEWHLPARYLQTNNCEIYDIHECEQLYPKGIVDICEVVVVDHGSMDIYDVQHTVNSVVYLYPLRCCCHKPAATGQILQMAFSQMHIVDWKSL